MKKIPCNSHMHRSSRFLKKSAALILTVLLVSGTLAGCGKKDAGVSSPGSGSSAKEVTLNEVAHSIFYAPMYVAIEEGYDIGFMGSESTIYTYAGDTQDYVVNFAQLTQRAGNFLVSRTPVENFSWDMLKGTDVLGGRAGGMPEMVFEFILKKNGIDPKADLNIDQSIDFGSTAAAFSGGPGYFSVVFIFKYS